LDSADKTAIQIYAEANNGEEERAGSFIDINWDG
jgi:hypothetical protein